MEEQKTSAESSSNQQIEDGRALSAFSTSAPSSSTASVTIGGNDGGQGGVQGVYQAGGNISGNTHNDNHSIINSGAGAGHHNSFDNRNNQGKQLAGPNYGTVNQGDTHHHYPNQPLPPPPTPTPEELKKMLETIQSLLREIYSQSYRKVIPFSLPYFFDIERKWVDLTLKLEDDLTEPKDYAAWFKKAFAEEDMLIVEGDPGVGKSSFIQRLAYEWTQEQSPLRNDYILVLHIEFRKLREYKFKNIEELIIHYMKSNLLHLKEEDYKILHYFINDPEWCKVHKILVLLDGYDESSLEEQCQELSDFFSSTTSRPLRFNVLITSRKGYLSKHRNQGRFTFADVMGFTTESQRQEYIKKHFNAINDTVSSENITAVTRLLHTNGNLGKLAETPLMLTFICLVHKKIIDGTEVELYMNIIWWMIDRYQKSNPNQDVPSLFGFKYDASDKFHVIENNYKHFPQLHLLGTMAMQDIFKSTFTETDLKKFKIKEIVQEVGFLRKEFTRDTSYHTIIEFSFVHRTLQEFIMALTFFVTNKEPPKIFIYHVFFIAENKGYGIIPGKIQAYLKMIYSSKIKIKGTKKQLYSRRVKFYKKMYSNSSPQQENSHISRIHLRADAIDIINKHERIPQSSEEAMQLLRYEAEQGDILAQYNLGLMYLEGIITVQSNKEAAKWFRKSAEQGNADAQNKLGWMYYYESGIRESAEEAVKWYRKAAEQGNADIQLNLRPMYKRERGVPQSDEEAVKWFRNSAEQGNADAQHNLGRMYVNGRGVPQSDEEAVKWFRKSAEQGHALAQRKLATMYDEGKGVPQLKDEAFKWFRRAAEQGDADALWDLRFVKWKLS